MKSWEEIRKAPHLIVNEQLSVPGCLIGVIQFEKWSGSIVIGTNEYGYEHVSVSPFKKHYMPTWDDMCRIKNLFWKDDEEAYQIHPKKSEYVNISENCLHIWKPIGHELAELAVKAQHESSL